MDTSSIFTRRMMGLDRNVWLVMIIAIILSTGLLGYKLVGSNKPKPCEAMSIFVNGQTNTDTLFYYSGNPVMFKLPVSQEDKVIWNFGDETRNEAGSPRLHTFHAESIYRVRATVNGICTYEKRISIKNIAYVLRDSTGNVTENIIGAEEANAGDSTTFSTTLVASSYEWYIENNSNYAKQTGKQAGFRFGTQGKYIVVLVLDHNRDKKFSKNITVSKLPTTENTFEKPHVLIKPAEKRKVDSNVVHPAIDTAKIAPPAPKLKYVTDELFKTYLQALVCGEMNAADFNAYLCQGLNTPVVVNNSERKTFGSVCKDLQGKKIKIASVVAGRDNDNCVINLAVEYDRKRFLGRNPCRN